MAVMSVQQIGNGTLLAPIAVAASDTYTGDTAGLVLEVINGGASPDSVVVVDPGATPAGSAALGGGTAVSVAAGTRRHFRILPSHVNSSGVVTVTHSFTTTVTYNLIRV